MMLSHTMSWKGVGTEQVAPVLGRDLRIVGTSENVTCTLKRDHESALVDLMKDVQIWRSERSSASLTELLTKMNNIESSP